MQVLKIVFFLYCIFGHAVYAQIPVSTETFEIIEEKFFDNGELSHSKIELYKEYLQNLQMEAESNISNYKSKLSTSSRNDKYVQNIKKLRIEWVPQIFNISSRVVLIDYLSKIIDFENALSTDVSPTFSESRVLGSLHKFMYNFKINSKRVSGLGESNNLVDPKSNKYFSQTELSRLKDRNVDLSKLDPPKENGVIELIEDISSVDPKERFQGNSSLYDGIEIKFPRKNIGFYKGIKKNDSTIVLEFETIDEAGKTLAEFKLNLNSKIHSEITAASLGSTLGLYHDISKHVENFKIYTGDKSWDEFVLEFSSTFKYEDLKRIVVSHGVDKTYGSYVIFKEGVIEANFNDDELSQVGPFYPGRKKGKREVRALMLFNMWIGNADLKPGQNNKTLVRTKIDTKKLYYMQHDVGFSFGYYEKEKPTEFPWSMVKSKINGKIIFNYRSFVPNFGWNHVTYADSKWMARKIAQLTREQITECVKLGKWPNKSPYNYEQLIIEKLISRRNQLVKAFDLAGEKLSNGRYIKFMKFNKNISKDAVSTENYIDGYSVDFKSSVKYSYAKPALRTLRGTLVDGLAGITQRIDKISIPDTWIGLDTGGVIALALVGTDKQVIKNPNPEGIHDKYIVREGFRVGARLGYGAMFRADSSYIKEYTLVYPVSDLDKIDKEGTWIVDVTMPYRIMKNFLPAKHILITESYVEGAARTRIETPLTGLGNENHLARVNLSRTIISKKQNGVVKVFEDTSKYNEVASKFYLKLGMFRLDQYMNTFSKGSLNRDVYELKINKYSSDAIDRAVMNNDPEGIKRFAVKTHEINSNFIESTSQLNIFGFFQKEKRSRTDDFEILTFNQEGKIEKLEHQIEGTYFKKRSWKLITNGEERIARVTMSAKSDENNNLIDPYLFLNFEHVDLNTTANEIDNAYIPFFNGIANDSTFIKFSAGEQSLSGRYGHINLHLREKIYKEGLEKLLKLRPDSFWKELSNLLGVKSLMKRTKGFVTYQGRKYKLNRVRSKAKKVLSLIKLAQSRTNLRFKIKSLMKAIVESIPRKRNSQNPIVLATLNKIMGEKNFYLNAEIESPGNKGSKLPGGITPYNSLGFERPDSDRELMRIQLGDALKIYNLF